jgi:ribosomal protein L7/L12
MSQPQVLPPEVLRALEQGKLIEAIKLLRQTRGLGLKEAKHAVDSHMGRSPPPRAAAPRAQHAPPPVSVNSDQSGVLAALQAGNKVEAIRRMRNNTGMGLQQAKEAVEVLEGKSVLHQQGGLAPGEVPPSGSRFNWIVLAIAAALVAWFLLRR